MNNHASFYSVALLSLAKDENKVMEYINEIKVIISLLQDDDSLIRILKSYALSKEEKKETIGLLFKGKTFDNITNLFNVLIDNNRGNIVLDVLNEFVRQAYESLNIKQGVIYTTYKLSPEVLKKLEVKVSKITNFNVVLENKIDEKIVGGFLINVDGMVIDETIKSKLESLKETLL